MWKKNYRVINWKKWSWTIDCGSFYLKYRLQKTEHSTKYLDSNYYLLHERIELKEKKKMSIKENFTGWFI